MSIILGNCFRFFQLPAVTSNCSIIRKIYKMNILEMITIYSPNCPEMWGWFLILHILFETFEIMQLAGQWKNSISIIRQIIFACFKIVERKWHVTTKIVAFRIDVLYMLYTETMSWAPTKSSLCLREHSCLKSKVYNFCRLIFKKTAIRSKD